jgi:hypothetical protein
LAERWALPRRVRGGPEGPFVAALPGEYDAIELIISYPGRGRRPTTRQARQAALTPLFNRRELDHALKQGLTDRQREVLEARF